MLGKLSRGSGFRATLECDKARDFDAWPSISLRLEPAGDSLVVARAESEQVEAEVLDVVCGALVPMSKRAVRSEVPRRAEAVDRALNALVSRDRLVLTEEGYTPRVPELGHTGTHPGSAGSGPVSREGTGRGLPLL